MQEAWVVIAFVEVFEDGGEDLRGFVREGDAFGDGFEELGADYGGEEGGEGEDIFVGGEEALFGTDAEGHDWGSHCTVREGGRSQLLGGRSQDLESELVHLPAFDGTGICCRCSRFVGFFGSGGMISK